MAENRTPVTRHHGTSRRRFLRSGVAATALLTAGSAGTVSANARPTPIDDCTTITSPGRYVLTEDLDGRNESACIEIRADDVHLDGRNHTIDGGGTGRRGVQAGEFLFIGVSNVTIENLRVTGFTTAGIAYEESSGGAIRNVTVTDSRHGIEYLNARDVSATGNVLSRNRTGVFASEGGDDNVFAHNAIAANTGAGATIFQFGRRHVFRQNRITGNGGDGLVLSEHTDDPHLVGNTVLGNDGQGISMFELTGAHLEQNRIFRNGGDGISLKFVDGSRLVRNVSQHNADDGIELDDSDDNALVRNVVRNNGDEAIAITGTSAGNTLSGNVTD